MFPINNFFSRNACRNVRQLSGAVSVNFVKFCQELGHKKKLE